jgi:hypothetical protein
LTDGDDTASNKITPHALAAALQADGIILDSVLLVSSNKKLKAVTIATGGCCFNPPTYAVGEVRCTPLSGMIKGVN